MDVSVLIPTCRRRDRLRMTLEAYGRQTVSRDRFEVIVVEDGPSGDARTVAESCGARYVDEPHSTGPAAARNVGLKYVTAPLILFTGDDMVPDPDVVERHIRAHEEHPRDAILGHILWHPTCAVTPFMRYLVEVGGQFSFHKIADPEDCHYRYFYASNLSVAADWFRDARFDEDLPWAVLEDVELAYRLKQRGLIIRYRPDIVVRHYHPITVAGFGLRMMRTGRSAYYIVTKHRHDRSLRRTWMPFTLVPGGLTATWLGGFLLGLLPPCRAKWFGVLCRHYARGIRLARRERAQ